LPNFELPAFDTRDTSSREPTRKTSGHDPCHGRS
jgi:hypothetical protein